MKDIFNTIEDLYNFRDKLIRGFPSPTKMYMGRTDDDKFYIMWGDIDTNIKHYKIATEALG